MDAAPHHKPHTSDVLSALTAHSFLLSHDTIAWGLRDAGITIRTTPSWTELFTLADVETHDAVLVDMDAIGSCAMSTGSDVSGHRFVTLLTRQLAARATAIVVMTSLDFAEVEDLAHAGVHVFLPPDVTFRSCNEYVCAAVARLRMTRPQGSTSVPLLPDGQNGDIHTHRASLPGLDTAQVSP